MESKDAVALFVKMESKDAFALFVKMESKDAFPTYSQGRFSLIGIARGGFSPSIIGLSVLTR